MKTALFLILYFFNQKIFSQIVLVPEKNVDLVTYTEQCQKPGYICSLNFVTEKIKSEETPQFNKLIETLDLLDDLERKKLSNQIINVLRNEMISLDQLQTLIQLAEKSLLIESNNKLTFLTKEMTQLLEKLQHMTENTVDEKRYLIFKKSLSVEQFKKLKPILHVYPFFKIDSFTIEEQKSVPVPYLTGTCDNTTYHKIFSEPHLNQKFIPLFKVECGFSTQIRNSMSKASNLVVEYKTPIIWTALAAGALLFMKNYSVEFK